MSLTKLGAVSGTLRQEINDITSRFAVMTTTVTANTNTTLANLTGLFHPVEANATYRYRVVLQTVANASGGHKVAFKQNEGAVISAIQNVTLTAAASANTAARTTTATDAASLAAVTAANVIVILEGTFTTTSAGVIQVQGAQNASHASDSQFLPGSTFELRKIA
jgi:hypothetical protein